MEPSEVERLIEGWADESHRAAARKVVRQWEVGIVTKPELTAKLAEIQAKIA